MSDIQILNPTTYPGWDDLLLSTPGYSFFHSSAWARVLSESYGYTPLYFANPENGRFRVLIPMMEINSYLTGKRGVSLPFTDYCEPIIHGDLSHKDLFNEIVEFGKKRHWKYIELRGGNNLFSPNTQSATSNKSFYSHPSILVTYLGHHLNLPQDGKDIFVIFHSNTKRNIKKAIREGLQTDIYDSLDSVKEFYRLNCLTRKEHGLPPQPYHFFEEVYENIISCGKGIVILVSLQNRNVAGAVYFHFGDKAVYKYGASDKTYQSLRANNLVMWEAIQYYSRSGYRSLCFGRTDHGHEGLRQFKSGWGTTQEEINYYRYNFKKDSFVRENSKFSVISSKIFRNMPPLLLKTVGSMLYKHVG